MGLRYPWLFAFLAVLIVLYLWKRKIISKTNHKLFSASSMQKELTGYKNAQQRAILRSRLSVGFFTIFLVVIALIASRPYYSAPFADESKSLDVVVALDASKSMYDYFQDVSKSMQELLRINNKDRIGLVLFAEQGETIVPLTDDKDAFTEILSKMQSQSPQDFKFENTSVGSGSAIGDGMLLAAKKFQLDQKRSKVVLLVTDGEINAGVSIEKATEYLASKGIVVYALAPPVEQSESGPTSARKDRDALRNAVEKTGGKYFNLASPGSIQGVFSEINQLERTKIKRDLGDIQIDNPELFIFIAFASLLGYLSLKWGILK